MANGTTFDDLFIIDDEYIDTAPLFQQKINRIQQVWNEYIRISEEIVGAQGSLAGSRAEAYSEFLSIAKQQIGTKLQDIGTESQKDMETYISMIEEADSILY